MSVLDRVIAAVAPPESEESRREARARARAAAKRGDWLSMILKHHEQIEAAFAEVKSAATAGTRLAAQRRLGIILTGHSNAEESVIYPALTAVNEKGFAAIAYTEQAAAKTQMAMLEKLAPMTQDYLDQLEHIRGAVAHHVYEEEGTWFLRLKQMASTTDQAKLATRYQEEFDRYVGRDGA